MTSSPHCSIVPPYLLSALAASDEPRAAGSARETLRVDELLRRGRVTAEVRPDPTVDARAGAVPDLAPGTAAGPVRSVHDAGGGTDLPGTGVRAEGDGPSGDEQVDQAYDGLGATWAMWQEEYARTSLDGKGLPLLATVHYGQDYDNAFWDGRQMVFGDGDGVVFLPFTRSLDVIAHELAHGVTQYTSGLNYQGQSGALNESVSDVFGVLVVQHHLGQSADEADWLVGADLLAPGVQGVALRSMKAPGTAYDDPRLGTDPQPAHMRDYVATTADNGGVHINSGIPNKAFHDLAVALGGNAWEVAGQVWYDTVVGDIRADCDFATFAGLTLAAASARYGEDSPVVAAVRSAWTGVGVLPGDEDGGAAADGAQADPPVADEEPGDADPTTVRVRRTGGVAGTVRERTVDLTELPVDDAHHWRSLLAAGRLRRIAEAARTPDPVRDGFCWTVACDAPPLAVDLPESGLTPEVRGLLDRTVRRD
ncbi:M4 family metallopeptidase [Phycicoccus sp. BSK3Z-2]|uniref:Neutral metalloproteinase n=1 Tax=Phycicoccus avicenniae TaxID=2828860 RepID=A0A941D5M9_9MICO|nr:protealysin inhibitor emfourin [Phycicoccus avicenniae]MBR7742569.1 M4 family metallopeptidase [Phycicoccus avicenniae]